MIGNDMRLDSGVGTREGRPERSGGRRSAHLRIDGLTVGGPADPLIAWMICPDSIWINLFEDACGNRRVIVRRPFRA